VAEPTENVSAGEFHAGVELRRRSKPLLSRRLRIAGRARLKQEA